MVDISGFPPTVRNYMIHRLTDQLNSWDFHGEVMIPDAIAHEFYPEKYPDKEYDYVSIIDLVSYDSGKMFLIKEDGKIYGFRLLEGYHNIVTPVKVLSSPESLYDKMLVQNGNSIFVLYDREVRARFYINDEIKDTAEVEVLGYKFRPYKGLFNGLYRVSDIMVEGQHVYVTNDIKEILNWDCVLIELGTYSKFYDEFKPTEQYFNKPKTDKFIIGEMIYDYKKKGRVPRKKNAIQVDNLIFSMKADKDHIYYKQFEFVNSTTNFIAVKHKGDIRIIPKVELGVNLAAATAVIIQNNGKHTVVFRDAKTNETLEFKNVSSIDTNFFGNNRKLEGLRLIQFDDIKLAVPIPASSLYVDFPFKLDHIEYDTYKVIETDNKPIIMLFKGNKTVGFIETTTVFKTDKPIEGLPENFITSVLYGYYLWTLEDNKYSTKFVEKIPKTVLRRFPIFKAI